MTQPRNIGASVRARLTDRARANKENVQLVLTRYAIERLLYRLSRSPYRDHFVLKGAMLFSLWMAVPYRATGDLDLLGFGPNDAATLADTFRTLCAVPVDDDGVQFLSDTVKVDQVRENEDYQGVRVTMTAIIAGARLPVQVDVGYGDAVTPAPQEIDYPTLLDFAPPKLRAYPPECPFEKSLGGKALAIWMGETVEHESDHGESDHGFRDLREFLVILG